jgi:hypothetical protein
VESLAGSLKMRMIFFFLMLLWSLAGTSEPYFIEEDFISVGQNSFRGSTPLTLLSCGHRVKTVQSSSQKLGWTLIEVGPYRGYVKGHFLKGIKPICFQDKFPKFFQEFKIGLTDMLYWAQLNDNYFEGKTK